MMKELNIFMDDFFKYVQGDKLQVWSVRLEKPTPK